MESLNSDDDRPLDHDDHDTDGEEGTASGEEDHDDLRDPEDHRPGVEDDVMLLEDYADKPVTSEDLNDREKLNLAKARHERLDQSEIKPFVIMQRDLDGKRAWRDSRTCLASRTKNEWALQKAGKLAISEQLQQIKKEKGKREDDDVGKECARRVDELLNPRKHLGRSCKKKKNKADRAAEEELFKKLAKDPRYLPPPSRKLLVKDVAFRAWNPIPVFCDVENGHDLRPPSFGYVEQNTSSLHRYRSSAASYKCNCQNGCREDTCVCVDLNLCVNGEQGPYLVEGKVFIQKPDIDAYSYVLYACGPKCGCPPSCPNRIDNWLNRNHFEIFRRNATVGFGLRTMTSLAYGELVCEFKGEVKEGHANNVDQDYALELGTPDDDNLALFDELRTSFGNTEEKHWDGAIPTDSLFVDPIDVGNEARFISHGCTPNLQLLRVVCNLFSTDKHHLVFFANCDIPAGTELTFNYGSAYINRANFECLCGTLFCNNNQKTWEICSQLKNVRIFDVVKAVHDKWKLMIRTTDRKYSDIYYEAKRLGLYDVPPSQNFDPAKVKIELLEMEVDYPVDTPAKSTRSRKRSAIYAATVSPDLKPSAVKRLAPLVSPPVPPIIVNQDPGTSAEQQNSPAPKNYAICTNYRKRGAHNAPMVAPSLEPSAQRRLPHDFVVKSEDVLTPSRASTAFNRGTPSRRGRPTTIATRLLSRPSGGASDLLTSPGASSSQDLQSIPVDRALSVPTKKRPLLHPSPLPPKKPATRSRRCAEDDNEVQFLLAVHGSPSRRGHPTAPARRSLRLSGVAPEFQEPSTAPTRAARPRQVATRGRGRKIAGAQGNSKSVVPVSQPDPSDVPMEMDQGAQRNSKSVVPVAQPDPSDVPMEMDQVSHTPPPTLYSAALDDVESPDNLCNAAHPVTPSSPPCLSPPFVVPLSPQVVDREPTPDEASSLRDVESPQDRQEAIKNPQNPLGKGIPETKIFEMPVEEDEDIEDFLIQEEMDYVRPRIPDYSQDDDSILDRFEELLGASSVSFNSLILELRQHGRQEDHGARQQDQSSREEEVMDLSDVQQDVFYRDQDSEVFQNHGDMMDAEEDGQDDADRLRQEQGDRLQKVAVPDDVQEDHGDQEDQGQESDDSYVRFEGSGGRDDDADRGFPLEPESALPQVADERDLHAQLENDEGEDHLQDHQNPHDEDSNSQDNTSYQFQGEIHHKHLGECRFCDKKIKRQQLNHRDVGEQEGDDGRQEQDPRLLKDSGSDGGDRSMEEEDRLHEDDGHHDRGQKVDVSASSDAGQSDAPLRLQDETRHLPEVRDLDLHDNTLDFQIHGNRNDQEQPDDDHRLLEVFENDDRDRQMENCEANVYEDLCEAGDEGDAGQHDDSNNRGDSGSSDATPRLSDDAPRLVVLVDPRQDLQEKKEVISSEENVAERVDKDESNDAPRLQNGSDEAGEDRHRLLENTKGEDLREHLQLTRDEDSHVKDHNSGPNKVIKQLQDESTDARPLLGDDLQKKSKEDRDRQRHRDKKEREGRRCDDERRGRRSRSKERRSKNSRRDRSRDDRRSRQDDSEDRHDRRRRDDSREKSRRECVQLPATYRNIPEPDTLRNRRDDRRSRHDEARQERHSQEDEDRRDRRRDVRQKGVWSGEERRRDVRRDRDERSSYSRSQDSSRNISQDSRHGGDGDHRRRRPRQDDVRRDSADDRERDRRRREDRGGRDRRRDGERDREEFSRTSSQDSRRRRNDRDRHDSQEYHEGRGRRRGDLDHRRPSDVAVGDRNPSDSGAHFTVEEWQQDLQMRQFLEEHRHLPVLPHGADVVGVSNPLLCYDPLGMGRTGGDFVAVQDALRQRTFAQGLRTVEDRVDVGDELRNDGPAGHHWPVRPLTDYRQSHSASYSSSRHDHALVGRYSPTSPLAYHQENHVSYFNQGHGSHPPLGLNRNADGVESVVHQQALPRDRSPRPYKPTSPPQFAPSADEEIQGLGRSEEIRGRNNQGHGGDRSPIPYQPTSPIYSGPHDLSEDAFEQEEEIQGPGRSEEISGRNHHQGPGGDRSPSPYQPSSPIYSGPHDLSEDDFEQKDQLYSSRRYARG